jgi:uncharacterized metal-binding protein YceD (DUF177 family)
MKFTLAQIRKLQMPHKFSEELDLSEDLDGFEDIVSSKPCHVEALLKERGIDTFLLKLSISIELTLVDSISLKEVSYTVETDAEEIYTTDDLIDDAFIIDGQTLDTKEAVLTNILIAKPMSFTLEEDFYDDVEEEEIEEEEEYINPAFASLKDLL